MKHNNLEILIILFQLLAIESEVYFQFVFEIFLNVEKFAITKPSWHG
jgi:hypothetical protein